MLITTAVFYGAGIPVEARLHLFRAGAALLAIGASLIPFTVWTLGQEDLLGWDRSTIWLMASALCLPVYLGSHLLLRDRIFALLSAVTGGSLGLAVLHVLGLPIEWGLCALVGLAIVYQIAGTAAGRHPAAARLGACSGPPRRRSPAVILRAAGDQAVPPALGPLAFGPGVPGRHTKRRLRVCGRHRLVAGRRFLRRGRPAHRPACLRLRHRLAAALRRPAHPHQGTVLRRLVRPLPGGAGGRLPAVRALRAGSGVRYRCARLHGGAVAAAARLRCGPGAKPARRLLASGRVPRALPPPCTRSAASTGWLPRCCSYRWPAPWPCICCRSRSASASARPARSPG